MKTINTELIERISILNEKVIKFAEIKVFKETGITLWQYNILSELIDNNLKTINELKANLLVSAPALSQILWRMELNWLISREINKQNKRETNINITKKAQTLYNEISKKYNDITQVKLSNFWENDKKQLIKLLDELEKSCFN